MNKLKNILPIVALTLVFAACDYNGLNFPGYDDGVTPTNVFSYEDSLVEADYAAISKLGLAVAENKADSVAAKSLATNKYFTDDAPSYKYIPLWLAKKYMYGDRKSSVMVTSSQYVTEEGELQNIKEKYILDSIWARYDAEILSEKFATDLGKFTAVSVTGDQVWAWSSYKGVGFAKISGYSGGNKINEDWLISPAMDMTKRKRATLTFDHTHKYGVEDYASQMTLWVTDNYQSGTPDVTKWKQLSFTYQFSSSYTFGSSGPVSLNDYAGKTNVRIAFRYICDDIVSAPTWEVQNVLVLEPDE
jgi:hypothetical protein